MRIQFLLLLLRPPSHSTMLFSDRTVATHVNANTPFYKHIQIDPADANDFRCPDSQFVCEQGPPMQNPPFAKNPSRPFQAALHYPLVFFFFFFLFSRKRFTGSQLEANARASCMACKWRLGTMLGPHAWPANGDRVRCSGLMHGLQMGLCQRNVTQILGWHKI